MKKQCLDGRHFEQLLIIVTFVIYDYTKQASIDSIVDIELYKKENMPSDYGYSFAIVGLTMMCYKIT